MGLDMYLYEVNKPSQDILNNIKTVDDIYQSGHLISFDKNTFEDEQEMFEDLIDYAVERHLDVAHTNLAKILTDNGYPATWDISPSQHSTNVLKFTITNPITNKGTDLYINRKKLQKDYRTISARKFYIIDAVEVAYWRKAYYVQDIIHDAYACETGKLIQNCGWHKLTNETIEEINDYYEEFSDGFHRDIAYSDNLFYHEWY